MQMEPIDFDYHILTDEHARIIELQRIPKNDWQEVRVQQVTVDGHEFAECRVWHKTLKGWTETEELIRIPMDDVDGKRKEVGVLLQQALSLAQSADKLTTVREIDDVALQLQSIKKQIDELTSALRLEGNALIVMLQAAQTGLLKRG